MTRDHDEYVLVGRAQAGDAEAFGELVRRYKAPVYGYVLSRTGSFDWADDLAQETFVGPIRAFETAKRFATLIGARTAQMRRRARLDGAVARSLRSSDLGQGEGTMPAEWSMLHLTVRDGTTKRPVPARIHLKRRDGSCHLPPANVDDTFDEKDAPEVILPHHFRKNLHVCQSADIRSAHLTTGTATFPVPAGEFTLYVSRGHERHPVVMKFLAKPGEGAHVEVDLNPTETMARLGWHSGDMHIHFSRFERRDDLILAHLMAAEDLPAVNNMVYKDAGKIEAPQHRMGHTGTHFELEHSHQVIAGGEEFRDNNLYGHMIAAGISEVIEPISTGEQLGRRENYPLFEQVCDAAHEQGGIAGWAHGGTLIKLHESLPVEAALGKLDFVESVQFTCFLGTPVWYRLLNCGLRLATTGGSDFPFSTDMLAPWYPNLGLDRTYVQIDTNEPFTYERYLDGIRKGRTFATNGPLLLFEVNGQQPGAAINVENSVSHVEVRARAVCNYPVERLEIVVNGAVEEIVDGQGGQTELTCETRLPLLESSWLAARVRGRVEPERYGGVGPWNLHAHTSPVYVLKGGKPVLRRADATAMADYVRLLEVWYRMGGKFANDDQRNHLLENLRTAEAFYDALLRRA